MKEQSNMDKAANVPSLFSDIQLQEKIYVFINHDITDDWDCRTFARKRNYFP